MYIKLLKHMYKAPALPSVFCAYGNDAGKGEGDGDVLVGWLLWGWGREPWAVGAEGRELKRKARNGKGEDGRAGVRIRSKVVEETGPDSGQGRGFEVEYGGKATHRKENTDAGNM